jgi:tRNA-splicing ligase RtcB
MAYAEVPGARVPIRMWTDPATVESSAMEQLRNVASLPWIQGLAVMPDVHYGKGATVGSGIAMHGAVCPAAVGVDIGCGMSAVKTSLTANDLPGDLSRLRSKIEQAIPVGRGMHADPVDPGRLHGFPTGAWEDFWGRFGGIAEAVRPRRERAAQQMGTLGSGNHFIEFCLDETGSVWLMLHSGSRNIGKELADHHIGEARKLPHNQGLADRDLAVFVAGTPQMAAYRNDLFWAQKYAKFNRAIMMALFQDVIRKEFKKAKVTFEPVVSCHHNYVAEERYDGMDLLVTRKGAIRAGRLRHHPGLDGHGLVHRAGPRERGVLQLRLARGGQEDEPQRREEAVLDAGPGGADTRCGVPQGRRCRGRDPGRVQADREGHGSAAGPGGGRREAQAGGLRQGLRPALHVEDRPRAEAARGPSYWAS